MEVSKEPINSGYHIIGTDFLMVTKQEDVFRKHLPVLLYGCYHGSMIEKDYINDTIVLTRRRVPDGLKIIDWEKRGNSFRLIFGDKNLDNWMGDDWNDAPYDCNAEKVYEEYIVGYADYTLPFEATLSEPATGNYGLSTWDGHPWDNDSIGYVSKDDMKERKLPILAFMNKDADWGHDMPLNRLLKEEGVSSLFMGDSSEELFGRLPSYVISLTGFVTKDEFDRAHADEFTK